MPTVSRFVVWETAPESHETYPALARLLAEAGIESPGALRGQEPSLVGHKAPEIRDQLEGTDLGMVAHAWWPSRETTWDSLPDQGVDVLELSTRSINCLLAARIRTIGDLRRLGYYDLLRLKNMGRKSLREILRKLAAIRGEGGLPLPEIHRDQVWFPLAAVATYKETTGESLLDESVKVLKLSRRSTNLLLNAGIGSIRDLLRQGNKDLLRIRNLGHISLWEIREKLALFQPEGSLPPPGIPSEKRALPDSLLDQSTEALGLNARPFYCLWNAGIRTIRDLLRQSDNDLLRIKNLGRTSLSEICEKLAAFERRFNPPAPESQPEPGWFPLAALASYEVLGMPATTSRILRLAGIKDVHDLLIRTPTEICQALPADSGLWWKLHSQLACFRLFPGLPPPPFVTAHLESFRSAFSADIERCLPPVDETLSAALTLVRPTAASGLEEELALSLREEVRERHLPVLRRLLGWDGGPGTALQETARDFGVTRERIRQIARRSVSRYARERAVLLRRALRFVEGRAPAMAHEVEAALVREGITRAPFRLEALRATARCFEIDFGWDVHLRNGFRCVAKPADLDRIENWHQEARRRLSRYGVTNKGFVMAALPAAVPVRLADLCWSLLEGLQWLDDQHEWFWLPTARNPIERSLAKILRTNPQVTIEAARTEVLRTRHMHGVDLPAEVFRSFCGLLPWCRIDGEIIARGEGFPGAPSG